MRTYTFLIIHCTGTPEGMNVTKEHILRWHTAPQPKGNGWSRAGYNDLILLDGTTQNLIQWNQDSFVHPDEIANGAYGYNAIARHLAYAGGSEKSNLRAPKDTRTAEQLEAMEAYIKAEVYRNRDLLVIGHNQVSSKSCPSFDVPDYLVGIGLPDRNIVQAAKLNIEQDLFDMPIKTLEQLITNNGNTN